MRIYITSEEFNVLQEWQVPYAGYIKGDGYTMGFKNCSLTN
ncbi:hypothetical protein BACFRA24663_21045 [Bacteroides fragilis]